MSRLQPAVTTATVGRTNEILNNVRRRFGRIPAAVAVLASSPAALAAWWEFERALASSSLSVALREQIAVLTATENACSYCVSAHSAAAHGAGVEPHDIDGAQYAVSSDARVHAVLQFAQSIIRFHGDVPEDVLEKTRRAGVTDSELLEVVAVVAINTFNNYYVRLSKPEPDMPFATIANANSRVCVDAPVTKNHLG